MSGRYEHNLEHGAIERDLSACPREWAVGHVGSMFWYASLAPYLKRLCDKGTRLPLNGSMGRKLCAHHRGVAASVITLPGELIGSVCIQRSHRGQGPQM
jgi:hypothetical protein